MAGEIGRQTPDLREQLFEEGHRFSFVQAFRLLNFLVTRETSTKSDEYTLRKRIRVRPELSLDFPESDLISIEEKPDEPPHFLMTATFLGLYGASSPLPTFYTEDLFVEQSDDKSIARDFLDILNSPLYFIFFKSWGKFRLFYKIAEQCDPDTLQRLFCLLGLEGEGLQRQIEDSYSLLRYTGLTTQFPRSAEGLRAILSDRFDEPSVTVVQCVSRTARIPEDQRPILGISGNRLGENSYLGMEIIDCMGKFNIQIGPVDSDKFHRFLPDRPAYGTMNRLVSFYLDQPLLWDATIFLESETIQPARLSEHYWSQLGWSTWVFSENLPPGTVSVSFPGQRGL